MPCTAVAALWQEQARQWARIGPPLKPSPQDVAVTQRLIDDEAHANAAPLVALLLGVTPELVAMRWPAGSVVVAADIALAMIGGVWPGRAVQSGRHSAMQADWLDLPVRDGSVDLALGDGTLNQNAGEHGPTLVRSLQRVVRSGGAAAIRVFVRPERPEDPQHIWDRLLAHEIGDFQAFKFRLLMALCDDHGDVGVAGVLAWFEDHDWTQSDLAAHLDWPVETIATINAYRNQSVTYWFPTLEQVHGLVAAEFREMACRRGTYELADRCPTFVWRTER